MGATAKNLIVVRPEDVGSKAFQRTLAGRRRPCSLRIFLHACPMERKRRGCTLRHTVRIQPSIEEPGQRMIFDVRCVTQSNASSWLRTQFITPCSPAMKYVDGVNGGVWSIPPKESNFPA